MSLSKKHKESIGKYIREMKELEGYFRELPEEETMIDGADKIITYLVKNKGMPLELLEWLSRYMREEDKRMRELWQLMENESKIPIEKVKLGAKETVRVYEDIVRLGQLHKLLLENKNILDADAEIFPLFKNIDNRCHFGISSVTAGAMYYMVELLQTYELNSFGKIWMARGEHKRKGSRLKIIMEYKLQAETREEAEKKLEKYKALMRGKGVKVWATLWKMANEKGKTKFDCDFLEFLKKMSDESRSFRYSTREKRGYWEIIKLLNDTTIKVERKIKGKGRSKDKIDWLEQPLVEILGGRRENDKYPISMKLRILSTEATKQDFAPLAYPNEILSAHPSDFLLAFIISTVFARNKKFSKNKEVKASNFDWASLFEKGNLQKTAIKNKREAKIKTQKKMERIKEVNVISKHKASSIGIGVSPPQKPKGKT